MTRFASPERITQAEQKILDFLCSHPGRIVSGEALYILLYGYDADIDTSAVNHHIHHIRKVIGAKRVKTVYGKGFVLQN